MINLKVNVIEVFIRGGSYAIKIPDEFLELDCFSTKKINFVVRSDFSIRFAKCRDNMFYRYSRVLSNKVIYIPPDLCRMFNINIGDKFLISTRNTRDSCFIEKYLEDFTDD